MNPSSTVLPDPPQWLREWVQGRLLGKLFSEKVHDLVLKGGLAMRAAYDSPRATKDIDLDACLSPRQLQGRVRRAIHTALAGCPLTAVKVTEPKQTDTVARWKISGRDRDGDSEIHLTVEVSFRDAIDPADVITVEQPSLVSAPSNRVQVYTAPVLAFKKVKALLDEHRNAPRDLLDLFLMIKAEVAPPAARLADWVGGNVEEKVALLWDKIDSMSPRRFHEEVLPSLTPDCRVQWTERWEDVRVVVGTEVERWLRQSYPAPPPALAGGGELCRRPHP